MTDEQQELLEQGALSLSRTSKPPLRVYAGMLVAVIVGRWIQLASESLGWEFNSGFWIFGFLLLATVSTACLALYLESKAPLALAWMSCVLVGGFVTAALTPLLGAPVGFCVGGITFFRHRLAPLVIPSKTNKSPFRLYAGILVGAIVGRWIQLYGQSVGWYFDTHPWPLIFCAMAFFFTAYLAWCLEGRLHRLVIWLSCVLLGGFVTALMHPVPGALIGFAVGALALVHRFTIRVVLPSVLCGIVGGVLAGWWWLYALARTKHSLEWWAILVPLSICGLLLLYVLRKSNRRWLVCSLAAVPLFLIATVVSLPVYLNHRMNRIYDSMYGSIDVHPTGTEGLIYSVNPFAFGRGTAPSPGLEQFDFALKGLGMRPACGLGVRAFLRRESTSADIQRLAKFPFVTSIHVRPGCQITDAEFRSLSTRGLGFLTCDDDTLLSDAAFQNIDSSKLQNLYLSGPNFGDDIARQLTKTPWLAVISFDGTRITSEGLKQIDSTGPLYWLLLPNTQLDDEVFKVLDQHNSLWRVDLSGSKIDGRGIKNFRSFITNIDVSDTAFDTKHLVDFPPPQGAKATPNNCLNVERLHLANTQSNDDLFPLLMKLRKSLKFVDVAGSKLSLAQLKKLGLQGYGVDGELLTPENIGQLGAISSLIVHYDANQMPIDEIIERYESLRTAVATKDMTMVLRNAEITPSTFKALQFKTGWVRLKDAKFPDGKVRSYEYLQKATFDYSELQ